MALVSLRLNNIKNALQKLDIAKSIDKETKLTIINGLKLIIEPTQEEQKIINEVIGLLSKSKLMKNKLQIIITHRPILLTALNRGINEPHIEGVYRYNVEEDMVVINQLIDNGKNIIIADYAMDHVMYAIIMKINVAHNYVIIKFGYSAEIITRLESLKKEYNCQNLDLIGLKRITNQKDEHQFHQLLKERYQNQMELISINGKEKVELYKFSRSLLDEFNKVIDKKSYQQLINENELLKNQNDDLQKKIDELTIMIKQVAIK